MSPRELIKESTTALLGGKFFSVCLFRKSRYDESDEEVSAEETEAIFFIVEEKSSSERFPFSYSCLIPLKHEAIKDAALVHCVSENT